MLNSAHFKGRNIALLCYRPMGDRHTPMAPIEFHKDNLSHF